MLQRLPWMRPALQQSEAVLLPALFGKRKAEPLFSDRYTKIKPEKDPFIPFVPANAPEEGKEITALSTYVRPRGSMAGRSVLRAAGVYPALFHGQRRRQEYIFCSRRNTPWQSRRYR